MPRPRPSRQFEKDESNPESIFGRIVRERRKELGLLQWDLEGDDGLDQSHISRIERGVTQPCLRAILILEEKLQYPPGELIRLVRAEVGTTTFRKKS